MSLLDQLRFTNPINLSLSDKINLTFDEEHKRWKSDDVNLLKPPTLETKEQARSLQVAVPAQNSLGQSGGGNLNRSQSPTAQQTRLRKAKEEAVQLDRKQEATKKKYEDFERKKLTVQLTNKLLEKMVLDERIEMEKIVAEL